MSELFSKISAFFLSIVTALSMFGTSILKFITSDEGLIAETAFSDYNDVAEKFANIPGIDTDFVPQGLTYSEYIDKLLVCGYMNKEGASRIYIINPENGECEKYVSLLTVDGEDYTGHCGGIADFESNVWVVSGKYARRLPLDMLKKAENGATVQFVDSFNSGTRASYVNCSDGILWVGEYHKNGNEYVTEDSHHLTSPSGEKMFAWTCGYILESGNPQGFDYDGTSKEIVVPDYILETESTCQGFTQLPDGRFVTSISGSIIKSELNIYKNVLDLKPDSTVNVSEKDVPVYFLDSTKLMTSLSAFPRSEGIDSYNGKLLVLYESNSKKLLGQQIVGTDYIWSVTL